LILDSLAGMDWIGLIGFAGIALYIPLMRNRLCCLQVSASSLPCSRNLSGVRVLDLVEIWGSCAMLWDEDVVAVEICTTAYEVTTGSACERKDDGLFGVRVWQSGMAQERVGCPVASARGVLVSGRDVWRHLAKPVITLLNSRLEGISNCTPFHNVFCGD
jgi:hypothetical protein